MSVRVRFAPSPTGYLHVGGARTALFNWLFARHEGGEFRLRIENTDTSREVAEAVDQIQGTLAWLGLDVDGDVTFQMDRMGHAQEVARRLVDEDKAYEDEGAIRFRMPDEGVTGWDDLVLGRVEVPSEKLEDLVLVRSDGRPTYNFVSPLEDALDGITHVIRGQDHVSNTPKQLRILEAIGAELPVYAHVPLLNGPDGRKLSKRHGAITVEDFPRSRATSPEALRQLPGAARLELRRPHRDHEPRGARRALHARARRQERGGLRLREARAAERPLPARASAATSTPTGSWPSCASSGYEWDEELIRRAAPLVQEKIATLGEFPAFAGFFFARVEPDGEVRRRGAAGRRRARSSRSSRSRRARSRRRYAGWPIGSA